MYQKLYHIIVHRTSDLKSYLSIEEVVHEVISTVAYGGNALINVGPTHDGRILPVFEERLRQLGSWLHINGDSIYGFVSDS
jgi:alpha-L-fucosidase